MKALNFSKESVSLTGLKERKVFETISRMVYNKNIKFLGLRNFLRWFSKNINLR